MSNISLLHNNHHHDNDSNKSTTDDETLNTIKNNNTTTTTISSLDNNVDCASSNSSRNSSSCSSSSASSSSSSSSEDEAEDNNSLEQQIESSTTTVTTTNPTNLEDQQFIYEDSKYSQRGLIHKRSLQNDNANSSSIVWQFIKQLSPQVDLMKMCSPIFLLRPISTLELFTYYCEPTASLKVLSELDNSLDRMLNCLLFSLMSCSNTGGDSFEGLKPYNPILGEEFHGEWNSRRAHENEFLSMSSSTSSSSEKQSLEKKTKSSTTKNSSSSSSSATAAEFWLDQWISNQSVERQEIIGQKLSTSKTRVCAEQVSHHPPISAFLMENEACNLKMDSTFQILVKFKGNYIDMNIAGSHLLSLNLPASNANDNSEKLLEQYEFTLPHLYANGLFWGSSNVTNGDELKIKCKQSGLKVQINFSSGNELSGTISNSQNQTLFQIKGNICGQVNITKGKHWDCMKSDLVKYIFAPPPSTTPSKEKSSAVFFDCSSSSITSPNSYTNDLIVSPIHKQNENESRRVWHHVTYAIQHGDTNAAYGHKHEIEERQRVRAKNMKENGMVHENKMFRATGEMTKKHSIPIHRFNFASIEEMGKLKL